MSAYSIEKGWLTFPVLTGNRGMVLLSRAEEPVFTTETKRNRSRYFVDYGQGVSEISRATWKALMDYAKGGKR